MRFISTIAFAMFFVFFSENSVAQNDQNSDIAAIKKALETTGVGGWVHASVQDQMMLVFTWRRPNNFFVNYQFPMTSQDPFVLNALLQLNRHDRIEIRGKFIKNKAPLEHIEVTHLKVLSKYMGPGKDMIYPYPPIEDVLSKNEMVAKVHIVVNGGAVLVVEQADRVLPVFNPVPFLARDLFRNDKIRLRYKARKEPNRPVHLEVDSQKPRAIEVLERIEDGHGEPIQLTGSLVMFPKSPQIRFDIFAIREPDPDNIQRNYTLVNFEDMELFTAIREKLDKAWKNAAESARYDRNKFINPRIRVTAKGIKNVVAADQANPQILINDINDLKVEVLPL